MSEGAPTAHADSEVAAAHAPLPGQVASQALKQHITEMALDLLEEQVQARIVHYKADLATNPELDAITAQVVEQLRELQANATPAPKSAHSRESIVASHERILAGLLARVFREDAPSLLTEKALNDMHRKLARLFFQSELHEKTRGQDGSVKTIQHGEQALYYLFVRYQNRLRTELGFFEFESEDIKARSFELLARIMKDMQDGFLSRRSTQLKRVVRVFHEVLVDFFCKELAPQTAEIARDVIAQSATAEGRAYAYKVSAEAFPRFRAAFERALMTRLVGYVEDQLLRRLADTAGAARNETVQFITDPRVFSMICGELSESVYEFLCNEGFLDLPSDWRRAAAAESDAL